MVPSEPVASELARFRLETVATGIEPYPFSIAPLPDGRILLTEKKRGLSVVSPDGERSEPVADAPGTSDVGVNIQGLDYGIGWHLDVAPHPDYESNGWIYLQHTDLGADDDLIPVSRCRLKCPVFGSRKAEGRGRAVSHAGASKTGVGSIRR